MGHGEAAAQSAHLALGSAVTAGGEGAASLVWVAGHHHQPLSVPEANRDLPCIIHVADHLAGEVAGGFTLDLRPEGPDPMVLEALGLDRASLGNIRAAVVESIGNGDEMMAAA